MSKVTKLRQPERQTLRQDFDEATEALHQGRAVLAVAIHALNAKDDDGAKVAEELEALQVACNAIRTAEEYFENAVLRLSTGIDAIALERTEGSDRGLTAS